MNSLIFQVKTSQKAFKNCEFSKKTRIFMKKSGYFWRKTNWRKTR